MNHNDRMLDSGLEEVLGGVQPPDLVARVHSELEGAPREASHLVDPEHPLGGIAPTARRGFLRRSWPWWSVAAAAGVLAWAGGTFGSGERTPQVELEVRVLHGELTWSGTGESTRAEAGQQIQIPLREGVQLRSGTTPTALLLTQFGTLYTETNTILEVQTMYIRQTKGAVTIGALTLVVLTGAVTWNALARTEDAEIGETLRLEAPDPQPAGMTARELALQDENDELKRRLAAAEDQASRRRVDARFS